MKRIISIVLCLAVMISSFPAALAAPVIDFAVESSAEIAVNTEVSESVSEEVAVLAASAPTAFPLYDAALGELVYFEDFEDNSAGEAFSNGTSAFIYTGIASVGDNPSGSGKVGIGNGIVTAEVNEPKVTHYDSVTVLADLYMPTTLTSKSGWIRVSMNDSKMGDWNSYNFTADNAGKWNTVSDTFTDMNVRSGANEQDWIYEVSGVNNGMCVDNFRVYAKYTLTNQVRIVDGTKISLVDVTGSYTLSAPKAEGCNAWRDDNGKIYYEGDSIPSGITVVATYMPSVYDFDLGELVYYEDFEDGSAGEAFSNGTSAFIYTGIASVGDNPSGSGKVGVGNGIVTAEVNGPRVTHYDSVTVLADLYMPTTLTSKSGWIRVSMNDSKMGDWNSYRFTADNAGKWNTVSDTFTDMNVRSGANEQDWIYEVSGVNNGMCIDNYRVYAKYDIGNAVRLVNGKAVITELTDDTFEFPALTGSFVNSWKDKDGNIYMPGDTISAGDCKGNTFVAVLTKFDEVAKLTSSADGITSDRGEVTIKPEISYVTGLKETDFSDIEYVTDNANASIKRNADHSLTVTGQINGSVTVKAVLPQRIKEKLEADIDTIDITVSISGQPDRMVSTTFNVVMIGNSIRSHEPNESLKWTGHWGMAASSKEKDYAHRFIHYIEEKYGTGTAVLHDTTSAKAFEDAFANKDANENYASVIAPYIEEIVKADADIVTLQFGDNAKNVTSAKAYTNGVSQFIDAIKEAVPDAVIVISTPFFGGTYQVDGTIAAGAEKGVPVAELHKLYKTENLARSEYPAGTLVSGVDIHPGDRGMDNIAKEFFALADAGISKKEIEYATIPASVVIADGNYKITEEFGSVQLSAVVLPDDASQEIIWSLVSENAADYASISDDGVVTAINNGTVTARATSRFKEEVYAEIDVEITGQSDPFTVTYDGNAEDATVPAPNSFAKKGFRLDDVKNFASRPGYKFIGWSLTPDGEVTDFLADAESDTTVYAVWELGDYWLFERDGYFEDFTFANAFHQKVTNDELSVTATGASESNVLSVISPVLSLDSEDYYSLKLKMRNTEISGTTQLKMTIFADESYQYSYAVPSTEYNTYYFDLSSVSGTITGFKLQPTDVDCTVTIDEIVFFKNGDFKYAEKPSDFHETYGNLIYFNNFDGDLSDNQVTLSTLGAGELSAKGEYMSAKLATDTDMYSSGLFVYPEGSWKDNGYNGKITFVSDVFRAEASTRFLPTLDIAYTNGGYGGWNGKADDIWFPNWGNPVFRTAMGRYVTFAMTVSTSVGFGKIGFMNSSGNHPAYARSIAVYYMPSSFVKLIDGEKMWYEDLNGLEKYTFPESENEVKKGWGSSDGTVYLALESVPVSEIAGKEFKAYEMSVGKITYTGAGYEYVSTENGAANVAVRTDNYPEWDMSTDGTERVCIGWSDTENADTPVSNITVTESGVTLYPVWSKLSDAVDYEIEVSGAETIEIDSDDTTYEYTVSFTAEIPEESVEWTVSDESVAVIDENGVLTPLKNGNVRVTATAEYYPCKSAYVDVEISYKDGYEPVSVSFEGDVEQLPEGFDIIPGKTVNLGEYLNMKPNDDSMRFNGWILNGDKQNILSGEVTAVADTDMVFTAVTNYDFNFAIPQTVNGYYNYGTMEVKDGLLVLTPNNQGTDTFLQLKVVNLPASRFNAVEYYMDVNYTESGNAKTFKEGSTIGEFLFFPGCNDGYYVSGTVSSITEDGKYAVISHNLGACERWIGEIANIRNDLAGEGYFGYKVRYIRFVEKPETEDDTVTITGITAPVPGYAPDTTAVVKESFVENEGIKWTCSEGGSFLASGNFDEHTVYTVSVTLSSKDSSRILNNELCATINGEAADVKLLPDGTVLVSYTFEETEGFIPFEASISGDSTVRKRGRILEYKFNVSDSRIPDKTATWYIDNTDIAEINPENGKFSATKNGTVKITAVSNYNPGMSAEFIVTVEGIIEEYFTLSFDASTEDTVTGMPADRTVLSGKIELPSELPEREGYLFLGWSESPESTKVVDRLVVSEDTTLYAVWAQGHIWHFNNTNHGFNPDNGTAQVSDSYLIVKTTTAEDLRLYSPKDLDIDVSVYNKVIIRFAVDKKGFTDVYCAADGASIYDSKMLKADHIAEGLDNWQTLTFDFSSLAGKDKITRLWIDLFQSLNTTAYLDYIAVVELPREIAEGGSSTPWNPDNTVETVTKPGTIVPSGNEQSGSVSSELVGDGERVFDFSEEYQKELFDSVTSLENGYETEGVLSFRVFSKNASAAKTPEMIIDSVSLDASENRYIIVRARKTGLDNPNLRIFFTKPGEENYTKLRSVRRVLTDEYETHIYDMTENKHWNGEITSLRFTLENNTSGTLDIDWMIFTDTLPENTEYLNEAKDIFETVNSGELPFADVQPRDWYYNEVSGAYRMGLVNGKSENGYNPDDSVTLAEIITLAARLNYIYNGKELPGISEDGNWYDSYVNAAIDAKIISKNAYPDYNLPALRREVARIMAKALPSEYLEAINMFVSIPDMESGSRDFNSVLKLYNAGVLTGSDAEHNFHPDTEITRAELAAIINRMALPGARIRVYTDAEREADRLVFEGSRLGGCSLWNCTESSLKVDENGYAWATGSTTDPIALLHTVTGKFDGRDVVKVKLGIKWDKKVAELTPQLYYTTASSGSFSGSKMFKGVISEQDENGVAEVVFDVKSQSTFGDTVTQLRFDPFDLKDVPFAITYIIIE